MSRRWLTLFSLLHVNRSRASWLFSSELSSGWRGTLPDRAWRHLQLHLERYEPATPTSKTPSSTRYHDIVTEIIASTEGAVFPIWLIKSGTERNVDGMVRIAVRYGRIGEASAWAKERIRKVSGEWMFPQEGLRLAWSQNSHLTIDILTGPIDRGPSIWTSGSILHDD